MAMTKKAHGKFKYLHVCNQNLFSSSLLDLLVKVGSEFSDTYLYKYTAIRTDNYVYI